MHVVTSAVFLLCLISPAPARSGYAAPDLLREAEELLPYIRDVRRCLLVCTGNSKLLKAMGVFRTRKPSGTFTVPQVLNTCRHLHTIPELLYELPKTSEYIRCFHFPLTVRSVSWLNDECRDAA